MSFISKKKNKYPVKKKEETIRKILALLSLNSDEEEIKNDTQLNLRKKENYELFEKKRKAKVFEKLCEKRFSNKGKIENGKNNIANYKENEFIDKIFISNFNITYDSNILFDYVKEKSNIDKKYFTIIKVNSDGNCFYSALSEFLYSNSLYHKFIRNAVSSYCQINKDIIIDFQDSVEIRNNIFINTEEYINIMGNDKNWAVDIDIYISAFLFGINIVIYKFEVDKNYIEFLSSFYSDENNRNIPLCILINENENHFNLIKPFKQNYKTIKEKNLNNPQNNKIIFNNIKEKDNKTNKDKEHKTKNFKDDNKKKKSFKLDYKNNDLDNFYISDNDLNEIISLNNNKNLAITKSNNNSKVQKESKTNLNDINEKINNENNLYINPFCTLCLGVLVQRNFNIII